MHYPSFILPPSLSHFFSHPQLWVLSWQSPPSQTSSSKTTLVSTTLCSSLWSGCTAQLTHLMQPSPGQRMERLLSMTPPTSASGAPAVKCLLLHHLLLITFRHQMMAAMSVRLGMEWWLWTAPHCLSQVGGAVSQLLWLQSNCFSKICGQDHGSLLARFMLCAYCMSKMSRAYICTQATEMLTHSSSRLVSCELS